MVLISHHFSYLVGILTALQSLISPGMFQVQLNNSWQAHRKYVSVKQKSFVFRRILIVIHYMVVYGVLLFPHAYINRHNNYIVWLIWTETGTRCSSTPSVSQLHTAPRLYIRFSQLRHILLMLFSGNHNIKWPLVIV